MALLWACALLLCQIGVVVGQSYPSCSVSRDLELRQNGSLLSFIADSLYFSSCTFDMQQHG